MFKIKWLLFIAMLQSTLSYAWMVQDQCTNLKIQIINRTQSFCRLSQALVSSGVNLPQPVILGAIPPGGVSSWFVLSENYSQSTDFYGDPIHVYMQYECGDGKMVTFISQKDKCRRSAATVNAMVMSEYNMDTSFELSDGKMRDNTPGIIRWTFADRT